MIAKELYLKSADALRYAKELAKEIGGYVSDTLSSVDSGSDFDYIELFIPSWSGETPAYQVMNEDGSLAALYGYLYGKPIRP